MSAGRVGAVCLGLLGSALTTTLPNRGLTWSLRPRSRPISEHEQRGGVAAASVAEVARGAEQLLLALPTSLNHLNFINVYDAASEGDTHYIVMQLVEADTLASD